MAIFRDNVWQKSIRFCAILAISGAFLRKDYTEKWLYLKNYKDFSKTVLGAWSTCFKDTFLPIERLLSPLIHEKYDGKFYEFET